MRMPGSVAVSRNGLTFGTNYRIMKVSSSTVLEERREFRSARPRVRRKADRLGREPELSHFCHPLLISMIPAAVSRSKVTLLLFSKCRAVTPQIASAIHRNGSAFDRQSYRYGTPPLSAKVSKGGAVPASLRVLQAEQLTAQIGNRHGF